MNMWNGKRYVTVQHRGAGKATAMLQEAELRDKKRRAVIKAAEDALETQSDGLLSRDGAITIVRAIIAGKIPAVSMSFL